MKKCFRVIALISVSLALLLEVNSSVLGIGGLVYVNDLHTLTENDFAKIRDGKEVEYILSQVILYPSIFSGSNARERDRIIELAEAGKKVVVQFWFGPGGWYNWSYCGYPNIAMHKEVRDYLFQVIDRAIDQIGPEHIYGAHLLEEDCYFAVDIDEPGDWRQNKGAIRSGYEDGNTYTNFRNITRLYNIATPWHPKVPNVGQYAPEFMAETGLDMHNLPNDPLAMEVRMQWMRNRLWVAAHREFFKHLDEKYPTIRKFVWGSGGHQCGSTMYGLGDVVDVDGVITDLYNWTYFNYHGYSHMKTNLPDAEHLTILWGKGVDENRRRYHVATAYISGVSGVGFFEADYMCGAASFTVPELWAVNKRIFQDISRLPVAKPESEILIINGNIDNGYSTSPLMFPIFKHPAITYYQEAAQFDLSEYKMIVLHHCTSSRNDLALSRYNMNAYGPDDQTLEDWVASGGMLVMTPLNAWLPSSSEFFLAKKRLAWTVYGSGGNHGLEPGTFSCSPSVAQKYNIKPSYTLWTSVSPIQWGNGVYADQLPIGGVMEYGRGRIVFMPSILRHEVMCDLPWEERKMWFKAIADYVADVVRGVAMLHDRSGHLAEGVVSPGEPFGLAWEDKANGVTVRTVFEHFGQTGYSEITIGRGKNKSPANADKAPPLAMESAESGDSMDSQEVPEASMLLQNYPNSFNPDTWIPYQLSQDGNVNITIYDISGSLIRKLDIGSKPSGFYMTREKAAYWDGKNEAGEPVASGVYFYTIQAGEFTATKKMIVAR